MKIINLQAENIKRLTAIEITPSGNMVEITGVNGAGKTSVLDCIWWALAGKSSHQGKPVRDGETSARIRLDLGDLVVLREFKQLVDKDSGEITDGYTTKITVTNADGAVYPSPQKMLDALLSSLAFDPLIFLRAKQDEQFRMLEQYVPDVDFEAVRQELKNLYSKRTEENAEAAKAQAFAESVPVIDADLEPVDIAALNSELDVATKENADIESENFRRRDETYAIEEHLKTMESFTERVNELKDKLAFAEDALSDIKQLHFDKSAAFDRLPGLPELTDISEIYNKVTDAVKNNEIVNQRTANLERKSEYEKQAQIHKQIAADITAKMQSNKDAVKQKIAAAKMPVDGLTLGDGKILYKGIPFDQASDADHLHISCAIAMDKNSPLRVIRIRHGSLLDSNRLQTVHDLAIEMDYQVWIERVDSTGKVGFVIEDGSLKGSDQA